MKRVKRIIAVILLALTALTVGYSVYTCGRLPELTQTEAVYEQA